MRSGLESRAAVSGPGAVACAEKFLQGIDVAHAELISPLIIRKTWAEEAGGEHEWLPDVLACYGSLVGAVQINIPAELAVGPVSLLWWCDCLPRPCGDPAVSGPLAGRHGLDESTRSTLWPILFRTDLSALMVSVGQER